MVYFDTKEVVLQFIENFKERFKYNEDYRRPNNPLYAKFPDYSRISLESIDEDIALWSLPYYCRLSGIKSRLYFYSDLRGKMLFGGKFFEYATAFSCGCALVCDMNDEWSIINLNTKEIIAIPKNLGWKNLTDFRNNSLAMLDKSSEKWGAYTVDYSQYSWQLDIPFIWDFLSLSRDPDLVYAGKKYDYSYYPNWEYGPYNHMIPDRDKSVTRTCYKVALLKKSESKTLEAFEDLENHLDGSLWAGGYRTKFITRCRDNIGDQYFHEEASNTGAIVDCGNLDDYSLVMSKKK